MRLCCDYIPANGSVLPAGGLSPSAGGLVLPVSAVAGAVSSLFSCACPAPHGGIFTFAVVEHPLGYIVSLIAGSIAGALMLAVLKKTKKENA